MILLEIFFVISLFLFPVIVPSHCSASLMMNDEYYVKWFSFLFGWLSGLILLLLRACGRACF